MTPSRELDRNANPMQPHQFAKRVLMTICGLTPQIVTETIFALATQQKPAFIPTEVKLVTTLDGAKRAIDTLLHNDCWFFRLCEEYSLPSIEFSEESIVILRNSEDVELRDIRTVDDNEVAANQIVEQVRNLTNDPESALHVSMAGGRKTMGYFTGYALSLFGRPQDRLSHILVTPPFESHPEFFYPAPQSRMIHSSMPESKPLDTHEAEITLASIHYVRLRDKLPQSVLDSGSNFLETVSAAQSAIGPPELIVDLKGKRISANKKVIKLPPAEIAFLAWFAERCQKSQDWISCPIDDFPEQEYAERYLKLYESVIGFMGSGERTAMRLKDGMTREFFSQTKSKLSRKLKDELGREHAGPYLVKRDVKEKLIVYGLDLKPEHIQFKTLGHEQKTKLQSSPWLFREVPKLC